MESNWDRYEEAERAEEDDDTPTQKGTNYHVLLESAGKTPTPSGPGCSHNTHYLLLLFLFVLAACDRYANESCRVLNLHLRFN